MMMSSCAGSRLFRRRSLTCVIAGSFFFSTSMTVAELTPRTRTISRTPLPLRVVYLYRAGNSGACKTGIMPLFHYHGRGQRDGIPPLFLPVGAVGSALAVLHVACCLAQQSRRGHPEATRAHATIPQAPSGPEALSWPHPHAPLRGLCAGNCAAPPSALRPTTPYRLHAWPPAPGGHVGALLPLPRL